MEIKEIRINRYKSIGDPMYLKELSGFQILVGSNNAGKTNILDAIHLFFEEEVDKERFFDKSADLEITLIQENKEYVLRYKNGIFSGMRNENMKKHFVRIGDSHDYRAVAQKLENFKKEYPENYKEFSLSLEKNFRDVEISEELFLLNVHADRKKRPVKRMGEGFKRLFIILFYIFHPQYKIILIDEPEIHLHPSSIRKFLYILESKAFKKQILLTTHHPTFVQAKYLPFTWRVTRNRNKSTCVYRFSKKDIDIDRFIQEINDDNSGMLFSDKVLLVEGVSDRIFMREIINRFYKKDKSVKVVYSSGKGSIDLYAALCESFNIPYAIMLDRDALNSPSLMKIKKYPTLKTGGINEKIKQLKEKEIFILERDLEHTYPKRFRRKETKPLTALFVSQNIREEELKEKQMKTIKDILETI